MDVAVRFGVCLSYVYKIMAGRKPAAKKKSEKAGGLGPVAIEERSEEYRRFVLQKLKSGRRLKVAKSAAVAPVRGLQKADYLDTVTILSLFCVRGTNRLMGHACERLTASSSLMCSTSWNGRKVMFEDGIPKEPDPIESETCGEVQADVRVMAALEAWVAAKRRYKLAQDYANKAQAEMQTALKRLDLAIEDMNSGQLKLF